jgi:hypothetical protein
MDRSVGCGVVLFMGGYARSFVAAAIMMSCEFSRACPAKELRVDGSADNRDTRGAG